MPTDTIYSDNIPDFAAELGVTAETVIAMVDAEADRYKDYESFVQAVNDYRDKTIESPADVSDYFAFNFLDDMIGPLVLCNFILDAADGDYEFNYGSGYYEYSATPVDE